MIKFANTANDVTVLAVKIDVVLKLHEKTVKLVGLRSKKVTYERRKNTLLGRSTHHTCGSNVEGEGIFPSET